MGKVTRDLIEYNGIDTCSYQNLTNFKQMNVDHVVCLPCDKPDIEQVIRVWVDFCIINSKVVNTPVGTSYEGQVLTGKKLLIDANIMLRIQYVSCSEVQSVHSITSQFPVSGFVVMKSDTNPNSIITPNISIEDIFSEQIDCRCIYNNITFMMTANLC